MNEAHHPTAQKLMDTVSTMLNGQDPYDVLVDEVLRLSGVSRGSLYHHFGDFPGLIQATLLQRFSVNVDADVAALEKLARDATSKQDYWERIRKLSSITQVPERAPVRAERARLISLAASGNAFADSLSEEQDRLTSAMAAAIQTAQDKGWVKASLSPRSIAVFLQAYSLGRAVDDIAGNKVPNDEWVFVVETALSSFEA